MNLFSGILRKKNVQYLLFLMVIIITAASIRSYTLFNNYMGGDELNHCNEARQYAAAHQLPVTGPGLYGSGARIPGGAYYTILSLCGAFTGQPQVFYLYSFTLFMLASLVFLLILNRRYGTLPALIIAGFMLISPTFLGMESRIWNPNFAALFSLLLAAVLIEIFSGNNHPLLMFILLPLSVIIGQCHLSALFYLPLALMIYFTFFYRGPHKAYFWAGIAGAVLLYVPYMISELYNGFQNTRSILALSGGVKDIRFPILTFLIILPTIDMTTLNSGDFMVSIKRFLEMPWYLVVFVFPALFASILFSISSFIYTFTLLIKNIGNNKKDKPGIILNETDIHMIRFTFILFAVLALVFIILRLPPWSPHYYYPVYAFCFIPLIYGIRFITDGLKWKEIPVIAVSLWIMVSGALAAYSFFSREYEPISVNNQVKYTKVLLDDAAGRPFSFKPPETEGFYKNIAETLLKREWKSRQDSPLRYFLGETEHLKEKDKLELQNSTLLMEDRWMKVYRIPQ